MQVRMIFAHEYLPENAKEARVLRADETYDLSNDLAKALILEGRAEAQGKKAE